MKPSTSSFPNKPAVSKRLSRTAAGHTLIAPPRDTAPRVRDAYESAYRSIWGDPPETIQDANTISSRLLLVAIGAGVTFVSRADCHHAQRPGIRTIPLDPSATSMPLHVAWHRDNTNPTLFAIREQLAKATRNIA